MKLVSVATAFSLLLFSHSLTAQNTQRSDSARKARSAQMKA